MKEQEHSSGEKHRPISEMRAFLKRLGEEGNTPAPESILKGVRERIKPEEDSLSAKRAPLHLLLPILDDECREKRLWAIRHILNGDNQYRLSLQEFMILMQNKHEEVRRAVVRAILEHTSETMLSRIVDAVLHGTITSETVIPILSECIRCIETDSLIAEIEAAYVKAPFVRVLERIRRGGEEPIASLEQVQLDVFQQLVLWLNKSTQSYHEGLRYLEAHPMLLTSESERELIKLISAYPSDQPEMLAQMIQHVALLRDAMSRGGCSESVREAYINLFGGWTLDVPSWLVKIEEDLAFLRRLERPERTKQGEINLLRDVITVAEQDAQVEPEILAELHNELGGALTRKQGWLSHKDQFQSIREAIACHVRALATFTHARYPLQFARTLVLLGLAYQLYDQPYSVEQAIFCYEEAAKVYTQDEFPEERVRLYTILGSAYAQRIHGDAIENIENARAHLLEAFYLNDRRSSSILKAILSINLGDVYLRYSALVDSSERQRNIEEAGAYYRIALSSFDREKFPVESVSIHVRLASFYRALASRTEDQEERDTLLRCAIVYYESTRDIYTLDAFPREYAGVLTEVGRIYSLRQKGDLIDNLERAAGCYRLALQVFTKETYPTEYYYTRGLLEKALRRIDQGYTGQDDLNVHGAEPTEEWLNTGIRPPLVQLLPAFLNLPRWFYHRGALGDLEAYASEIGSEGAKRFSGI